jgi:hypothetical protein
MPTIPIRYSEPQMWAYNALHSRSNEPVTVNMPWGRGSGKSWFERNCGIFMSVAENFGSVRKHRYGEQRGVRIIGLCPTLKQFRDVHGALLELENATTWSALGGHLNRTTLRITWPDGSWFQPMPAAVSSSKAALGMRTDVLFLDECDDIDPEVYDRVCKPWFTEPWSLKRVLAGGTPRRGRSGLLYRLHKLGLSKDPLDARYFSRLCTYLESPGLVDPREAEDARRTMAPSTFAREWLCDFDSAEGLVYPFDEDFHVRQPPADVRFFHKMGLGIDHGWQDPGVFLLCGVQGHGQDAELWVLDEHYHSQKPNDEWDAIASNQYRGFDAYPDPSRPDRIWDLRKAGLLTHEVDNSIEPGIARVANLMAKHDDEDGTSRARFFIAPHCVNTIRELKAYRRKSDPLNPGRFLEDIVDRDNHTMDALRYYAVGVFGALSGAGNSRKEVPGR